MNNNSSGPFARLGEGHGHMLEDYMKFKVNNNINQILTLHKMTFLIAEPCNSFAKIFYLMCIEKLTQNYLFWHLFFKFQDLVSRMLDFDPQKRISPYFAVRHPFLRKTTPEEQQSNSANVAYHSHSNAPMSLQAPGSDFVSRPTDQNKLLLYSISANNMAMSVYDY